MKGFVRKSGLVQSGTPMVNIDLVDDADDGLFSRPHFSRSNSARSEVDSGGFWTSISSMGEGTSDDEETRCMVVEGGTSLGIAPNHVPLLTVLRRSLAGAGEDSWFDTIPTLGRNSHRPLLLVLAFVVADDASPSPRLTSVAVVEVVVHAD